MHDFFRCPSTTDPGHRWCHRPEGPKHGDMLRCQRLRFHFGWHRAEVACEPEPELWSRPTPRSQVSKWLWMFAYRVDMVRFRIGRLTHKLRKNENVS